MTSIPEDIMEAAKGVAQKGGSILLPFDVGDAEVRFKSRWHLREIIAQALLAERMKERERTEAAIEARINIYRQKQAKKKLSYEDTITEYEMFGFALEAFEWLQADLGIVNNKGEER